MYLLYITVSAHPQTSTIFQGKFMLFRIFVFGVLQKLAFVSTIFH